jgi:hypothetical protein
MEKPSPVSHFVTIHTNIDYDAAIKMLVHLIL